MKLKITIASTLLFIAASILQPTSAMAEVTLEVESIDIHDSRSKTQMVMHMVITNDLKEVTEEGLKSALKREYAKKDSWTWAWVRKKWKDRDQLKAFEKRFGQLAPNDYIARQKKGSGRTYFTHYYINAFASAEETKSIGSWIGRLEWREGAHQDPEIQIRTARLEAVKKGEGERFGLTVKQRMQVRKESWANIVRAENKAIAKYPNSNDFMKQLRYQDKLQNRYRKQLAEKYSLTEEQLGEIVLEGIEKSWPLK